MKIIVILWKQRVTDKSRRLYITFSTYNIISCISKFGNKYLLYSTAYHLTP